jgi:hypothetical protein
MGAMEIATKTTGGDMFSTNSVSTFGENAAAWYF